MLFLFTSSIVRILLRLTSLAALRFVVLLRHLRLLSVKKRWMVFPRREEELAREAERL